MQYRKRPIVIDAIQLTDESFDECCKFIGETNICDCSKDECCLTISTLEGDMNAHAEDWIIKGVEGELYPCKNSIFQTTYEEVK
jgi:hypothetical protein